jgi:hypothetical protein
MEALHLRTLHSQASELVSCYFLVSVKFVVLYCRHCCVQRVKPWGRSRTCSTLPGAALTIEHAQSIPCPKVPLDDGYLSQ